ncbi:MAG: CARDB domain-containing protein [Candidatus Zhuqueibacterota bacterium]
MLRRLMFLVLFAMPGHLMAGEQTKPTHVADLDVTFISRTPRYERLRASYYQRSDGMVGDVNPYLTEAEKQKKRWPDEGEVVTFTAHVKNFGDVAVEAYEYLWMVDGKTMKRGISARLSPGQEHEFQLQWNWLNGPHAVSFQVDPLGQIREISTRNNQLTDRTDALTFHFHVEQSLYDYFQTIRNSWGTYSWDDWAQSHVALMNEMFRRAVYPTTPEGILERVRLDKITIHKDGELDPEGTHAPEDWEWDGRWGFKRDYLNDNFYEKNPWAVEHEWSLIHELGHQVGRIDLYCLDVAAAQNKVTGERYVSKTVDGMMHRGIYLPQHEVHFFCEHTAASFNRDKGVRRGFFGEYLMDIPQDNVLIFLNQKYEALKNAEISVYQAKPFGYTEKIIEPPAKFTGRTTEAGEFPLPENPFGEINNWGTNGIFLIEVRAGEGAYFHWMEIVDFNLEYWRGNRIKAEYKLVMPVE